MVRIFKQMPRGKVELACSVVYQAEVRNVSTCEGANVLLAIEAQADGSIICDVWQSGRCLISFRAPSAALQMILNTAMF